MKKFLATVLLLALPLAVLAQAPLKAGEPAARVSASRLEIRSTANPMASGTRAVQAALSPVELAIAQRVHLGRLPCELGAFVILTADTQTPGYFELQIKQQKYRLFPVETSTGTIRLEDQQAEVVWLQLANKSMLMNQKRGQRLADACTSAEQALVAEQLIKNPAPGLLDAAAAIATK